MRRGMRRRRKMRNNIWMRARTWRTRRRRRTMRRRRRRRRRRIMKMIGMGRREEEYNADEDEVDEHDTVELGNLLGHLWGPLAVLEASCVSRGASWGLLGASWGPLGGLLGVSWGPPGGPLWAILGPSWDLLGPPGLFVGPSWMRSIREGGGIIAAPPPGCQTGANTLVTSISLASSPRPSWALCQPAPPGPRPGPGEGG
eukprot:9472851-Pyramimonas_sp.AAC.1